MHGFAFAGADSLPQLRPLAWSNNAQSGVNWARVQLPVQAGQTYRIAVASPGVSSGGAVRLNLALDTSTADALFAQRPLARVILDAGRDFLFAVKDNQPGLLEAVRTSLDAAAAGRPDVETREKKGRNFTPADFGSGTVKTSITSAKRPTSPVWN